MTASNEPRVSDEDRDAAIAMILRQRCIFEEPERAITPSTAEAHLMTDAYIGHGWGPKPRVSRADLAKITSGLERLTESDTWFSIRDTLTRWLREHGIEVEP